jgi:hypothetical protein
MGSCAPDPVVTSEPPEGAGDTIGSGAGWPVSAWLVARGVAAATAADAWATDVGVGVPGPVDGAAGDPPLTGELVVRPAAVAVAGVLGGVLTMAAPAAVIVETAEVTAVAWESGGDTDATGGDGVTAIGASCRWAAGVTATVGGAGTLAGGGETARDCAASGATVGTASEAPGVEPASLGTDALGELAVDEATGVARDGTEVADRAAGVGLDTGSKRLQPGQGATGWALSTSRHASAPGRTVGTC